MDSVRNDTRSCNPLHTFCCGGRGEEVRLESRFCWDSCYRVRGIGTEQCSLLNCISDCFVPCVPVVCPDCLCPCAARVSACLPEIVVYCIFADASPWQTWIRWYYPGNRNYEIIENNIRRGCRISCENNFQSKRWCKNTAAGNATMRKVLRCWCGNDMLTIVLPTGGAVS